MFAHDTEVALAAAAALVNTGRQSEEQLPDRAALDAFVAQWQWTGDRTRDEAELEAVRALRPRLARLWYADEDEAVAIVNTLLRDARAMPQLVRHDGWGYHVHATSPHAPLADRMAVEAAMAFSDVIRLTALDRLRVCAARDCEDVIVDLSRNASRRFCDSTCGNRTNVAAYRARRRSATPAEATASGVRRRRPPTRHGDR
ncbi:MAG: CGNR zinc finger domain-containing protein [Kineosporiaceae bacterium]